MTEEIFDIVDENGQPTGETVTRSQAIIKVISGVLLMGILLFIPAGYSDYRKRVKHKVIPWIW